MKPLALSILLLTPLVFTLMRQPVEKPPPFDRQANEAHGWDLLESARQARLRDRPMERMPRQPEGYPSDPDTLSSTYEP